MRQIRGGGMPRSVASAGAGVGALAAGQAEDPFLARARALHLSVPMFDGHNDYPWEVRERAGKDPARLDIQSARTDTMTDIPRLRQGGVGAQFWSVYVPPAFAGQQAVTATLEQIDIVHRMMARYPGDFELATTADDVQRIFRSGQDRLAHRHGRRPRHRLVARRAADVRPPGRALHDAHPLEERAVGRLGDRHARARRAHRVRRGRRPRDEPAGDARRPEPRVGRDDGGCPARDAGAGHLLALVGPRALRSSRATCRTPSSGSSPGTAASSWCRSCRSSPRRRPRRGTRRRRPSRRRLGRLSPQRR